MPSRYYSLLLRSAPVFAALILAIGCGSGSGSGSSARVLQSITVAPADATLTPASPQQFTASGTFSDGSTQDLTNSVTWASSEVGVATIVDGGHPYAGLATAVAPGSTTITAASTGFSGTAILTVSDAELFNASPLNDMMQSDGSCLMYKSFPGALYENCSNLIPADDDADGNNFASLVQPLDVNGNPNAKGKVIFMGIGMSVALAEFSTFQGIANHSPLVNHATLVLWDGTKSGHDACFWFPADGSPVCSPDTMNEYDRLSAGLVDAGLNANQVQILWMDNGNGRENPDTRGCQPQGTLCEPLCDPSIDGCSNGADTTDALNIEWEFGEIMRAAKTRFPNLRLVFFSSRVFAGYGTVVDPEPFAYEKGFAIKWLIQAQINQVRTGQSDPIAGDLSYTAAPWLAWASYSWADGPIPRSDGLVWCNSQPDPPCNGEDDFGDDGIHLTSIGATKVANMLMDFFMSSPYTTGWFVK